VETNSTQKKKVTLILTYKKGFLYVGGETYPVKDRLKALGFKWDPTNKQWVKKTFNGIDDDYVDEYISEIEQFANIVFSKDSAINSVNKKQEHKEESKDQNNTKNLTPEIVTPKQIEKLTTVLKEITGNLQFVRVNSDIIEIAKENWTNKQSKYFQVYEKRDSATYYAIKGGNDEGFIIRDDVYDPGADLLHDSLIMKYIETLDKENLSKEEAGKRLESFIQLNYIDVATAKRIISLTEEREKKIEEQTSIMPRSQKVEQLGELFKNMKDKEAFLLPEFDTRPLDRFFRQRDVTHFKGVILWKSLVEKKYLLILDIVSKSTHVIDNAIYLIRDDSEKIESFLDGLRDVPFSTVMDEIEKYLKDNFNYREFSYQIKPFVKIETLYNDAYLEDGEEIVEGVVIDGYTDSLAEELKRLGFRRDNYISDKAWVKDVHSKEEAEKVIEELKKRIPADSGISILY